MSYSVRRAAVIGAGTMGRQIAGVIAGSETPVLLLDLVPKGANDRDILAKKALSELKKTAISEKKLALIQPGNIEDDLSQLAQADWIVECVPEETSVKRDTYERLGPHVSGSALVSSNTSTIPLSELRQGLAEGLRRQLCITHFFNPPALMPLLELVTDQDNDLEVVRQFIRFADEMLGRNVVQARDTPGFIANRIGMFWLLAAMEEARREGLTVEMADAVMNGAFGFPKTGVFALADMIGLRIIPDIAESMCRLLPPEDAFRQLRGGLALVRERLVTPGGKGFYEGRGREKKALDFASGQYRPAETPKVAIHRWHEFLRQDTPESRFARKTLTRALGYAANVAPDIAGTILQIDAAMRDGYGWTFGPFEMIQRLGAGWLTEQMDRQGMTPHMLLKLPQAQGFYGLDPREGRTYMAFDGVYHHQPVHEEHWTLALKTAGTKPLLENETAKLWDIGKGVACLEITTHMHVFDEHVLAALVQAVEKAEAGFAGLVIGHDGRHFSAGLDLHVITDCARRNDWKRMENILMQGQDTILRIKRARVPVIPALCGYALGGACEMTVSCIAAQAHAATRLGLVEADIGVIPAWGGTKEHLWRAVARGDGNSATVAEHALRAFRQIASAQKSANADDAFAMRLLADPSRISANRERLLADARSLCLSLAGRYTPRPPTVIEVPVDALRRRLMQEVEAMVEGEPGMEPHRRKLLHVLADALSGYRAARALANRTSSCSSWCRLTEEQMLVSMRDAFMELVQTPAALEKIRKVLGA